MELVSPLTLQLPTLQSHEFWFFPLGVCDALSYVPSAEEPAVSGPVRQPSDGPDSGGDALWYNTNFEGHSSFKLQWKCSEGEV